MRKILSLLVAAMMLMLNLSCSAQTAVTKRQPHPVTIDVLAISNDNSDGVTRMTVRLTSLPNTSSRVDSVTLVAPGGSRFLATDIDGIDFKRYFQWEDDGKVTVDVDFPRQTKTDGGKVIFHTVYGDFTGKIHGGIKR
ncbi:MAG: hypothetical protein K2O00_08745 [Muribaculaceae bacterium]|nr:hypothetical protein [Muribaculaceae bacterium]